MPDHPLSPATALIEISSKPTFLAGN